MRTKNLVSFFSLMATAISLGKDALLMIGIIQRAPTGRGASGFGADSFRSHGLVERWKALRQSSRSFQLREPGHSAPGRCVYSCLCFAPLPPFRDQFSAPPNAENATETISAAHNIPAVRESCLQDIY